MSLNRRFAPLLALSLLAVALPAARAADVTEGEVRAVAGANDAFALDLYGQLKDTSANTLFSPLSLSTALNMTSLGASGKTADEMAKVLHKPDVANFHLIAGGLLTAFTKSKTVTVAADNHLWIRQNLTLMPAFIDKTAKFYSAGASSIDFGVPETARKAINDAVAKNTFGKIADLIPSSAITPHTQMVLTNTLYFRGKWASRFFEKQTAEEDFRLSAEKSVKVQMMHNVGTYPYVQTADYQAVEIPYEGKRFSLLVLVPREGKTLADVEKRLTAEHLQDIGANIGESLVSLALPKFTVTTDFNASKTLSKMGMPTAFASDADFSAITGDHSLYLTGVFQKTYLAVDENGTEAASAAAVVGGAKDANPVAPTRMVVDQPFILMLIEHKSRMIFFMGRINDPTK